MYIASAQARRLPLNHVRVHLSGYRHEGLTATVIVATAIAAFALWRRLGSWISLPDIL